MPRGRITAAISKWWQSRYTWIAKRLDMEGPKEHGCITIVIYETEPIQITFQFAGMNGSPLSPYLIHHVLGLVAQAVERSVQPPKADDAPVQLTTEPKGVLV